MAKRGVRADEGYSHWLEETRSRMSERMRVSESERMSARVSEKMRVSESEKISARVSESERVWQKGV